VSHPVTDPVIEPAIQHQPLLVASLPMYDLPELRVHTDAFWKAVAGHLRADGINAPLTLSRPDGSLLDHWFEPDLLMSQTCGYPLVRDLDDSVDVVGSFSTVVDEEGLPGWYRTVIVARKDDPTGWSLVAANGTDSLSGWISLGAYLRAEHTSMVRAVLITGSHVASIEAVRNGCADLASIDSWTYHLLSTYRPTAIEGLMIVGRGPVVGVTPIITRKGGPVEALRSALTRASLDWGAPLGITGFVPHGGERHNGVLDLASDALRAFDATLSIRAGRIDDYEYLGPIDLASNRLFVEAGHPEFETDESIPFDAAERAVKDGRLWVAERYPMNDSTYGSTGGGDAERIGWVFLSGRDGELTIGQISVHPDWAQHGYGSALLDAIIRHAKAVGEPTIVLSTQDDVAWNRPWYEKFRFVVVPPAEWTPAMHAVAAEQTADGLNWATRVHMRLTL
jgi:GNAT superfamily N-acetyltransferase